MCKLVLKKKEEFARKERQVSLFYNNNHSMLASNGKFRQFKKTDS